MAAEALRPGYSRYYCQRCRRPLDWLKRRDSVTWREGRQRFFHDGCGGEVLLSMRDVK